MKFTFRPFPVPIVKGFGISKRRVGEREFCIDAFCVAKAVRVSVRQGGGIIIGKHPVAVREARIGKREIRGPVLKPLQNASQLV